MPMEDLLAAARQEDRDNWEMATSGWRSRHRRASAIPSDYVAVPGHTFPVKAELQKLGARWDSAARVWRVSPDSLAAAVAIVAAQPAEFTRSTEPVKLDLSRVIATIFVFGSKSSPGVSYQTVLYADKSISCNCKGWTDRCRADGSRTCTHTREVENGTALTSAKQVRDFTPQTQPAVNPVTRKFHL